MGAEELRALGQSITDTLDALDTADQANQQLTQRLQETAQERDQANLQVQQLTGQVQTLTTDRDAQRARADTAEAALRECQDGTDPEEPPPVTRPLLGMNFPPPAAAVGNEAYEPHAQVARVYVDEGRTDINKEPEFIRAMDLHIPEVVFSWKDTSTQAVEQCMQTIQARKLRRWIGANHHEPENDIPGKFSLSQWWAWQTAHMPLVARYGGIPTLILMAYTFDPTSGRRWQDYVRPGVHQCLGIDLYPKDVKGQKASLDRVHAAYPTFQAAGVQSLLLGEYGVPKSNPTLGVQLIQALKPQISDMESASYWSQQKNSADTDFHFTPQTAAAWYGTGG